MTIDREKLAQRLMATFLGELDEHVRTLDREALALEKAAPAERAELTKALFRTAHSLKGAARSVNLDVISAACHKLEEMLSATRDGRRELPPEQVQLLFAAADTLRDAAQRLRSGRGLAGSPVAELLVKLDDPPKVRTAAASPPEPAAASSPEPAPVTIPPDATPAAAPEAVRDSTVRIAAEKLDRLMAQGGELLIARRRIGSRRAEAQDLRSGVAALRADAQRLDELLRRQAPGAVLVTLDRVRDRMRALDRSMEQLSTNLRIDHHLLEQSASPLDDELRRAGMLPFSEVAEGLARTVRDAAKAAGKEVQLVVDGGAVEIGRSVLSAMRDPLLHLVRNAVDHGIEPPAAREQAGKPRVARVVVSAELKGTGVEIAVEDDGRGVDLDAVREQARRRGIQVPDEEVAAARLVFVPGLSTARRITELSGRGVGLDVVRHQVERLHGSASLSSVARRGARFVLSLPLTITTLRALLVRVAGRVYAVPSANVAQLARMRVGAFGSVEGRPVLLGQDAPIPAAELADVFGVRRTERRATDKAPVVVVQVGDRRLALLVDELVAEQEVVAKGMGARLRRVRHFTGATVLATGEIALIVSAQDVVAAGLGLRTAVSVAPADASTSPPRRLLIADDSVTTRTLEKTILEAAGYEVIAASDGSEAWHLLQERGADLVISDVEMPRMDGFMLAEAIRGSKRFRDLPVILLTALDSERDRARGLEVGADAYLVKSAFDQTKLLEAIAQLL